MPIATMKVGTQSNDHDNSYESARRQENALTGR